MEKQIKYYTTQVCFQEIPNEISYTYFLTNCPNKCPNCHSPHLRDDIGTLVSETLESTLKKEQNRCSCILFMGGDDPAQLNSLMNALHICKYVGGYKTALYSGFELDNCSQELLNLLDYIKVGPYIDELGGLKSKKTNQRLYKLQNGKIYEDITYLFWRSLDENYS